MNVVSIKKLETATAIKLGSNLSLITMMVFVFMEGFKR